MTTYPLDTASVARLHGCSRRTVQRWCKVLGFERRGRDWWLTREQIKELVAHVQPTRGNPEWIAAGRP